MSFYVCRIVFSSPEEFFQILNWVGLKHLISNALRWRGVDSAKSTWPVPFPDHYDLNFFKSCVNSYHHHISSSSEFVSSLDALMKTSFNNPQNGMHIGFALGENGIKTQWHLTELFKRRWLGAELNNAYLNIASRKI